jgi:hypothetical protein
MVQLPLMAPASGPTASSMALVLPPVEVEPQALRQSPDHTPAPPPPSVDVDVDVSIEPAPAGSLHRFTSRRVLVAATAASLAVLITVLVIAVVRGAPELASTSAAPPATEPAQVVAAPTAPAPVEAEPAAVPAHEPTPARDPAPARNAAPADAPRPLPAPVDREPEPVASSEPAERTPQADAVRSSPRPGKPATSKPVRPGRTSRRVAIAPPPTPESVTTPDDEEPATARARTAYNAGNQALFAGDTEGAIRGYRQALNAAPTFPPGFRGLGLAYALQGDNGPAIMALRTYISLAPRAKDVPLIKKRIAALATHR